MNILRKFLSSAPKGDLAIIPKGELYLTRSPNSPKGVRECLFKDAQAVIRGTSTDYHYQLVVTRVFEEGEEDLEDDEDSTVVLDSDEDEWTFLISDELKVKYFARADKIVTSWMDPNGDAGDVFEFVADANTPASNFDQFDQVCKVAQYERKYLKKFKGDESDLEEFDFDDQEEEVDDSKLKQEEDPKGNEAFVAVDAPQTPVKNIAATKISLTPTLTPTVESPKVDTEPVKGKVISTNPTVLHLFDASKVLFVEQEKNAIARIIETDKYEFYLEVSHNDKVIIGSPISSEMGSNFNEAQSAFLFNIFTDDGAFTWLLRFASSSLYSKFKLDFLKSLWETTNMMKWEKAEEEYVIDAFESVHLSDYEDVDPQPDDEEEQEEDDEFHDAEDGLNAEDDEEELKFKSRGKNSKLEVGMKNDRSFVVRGDKIGVFKQNDNDGLDFYTTIDNVADTQGRTFSPKKVMLHSGERNLVIQNPDNPNAIFNMDLETGKVIEEWSMGREVRSYAPSDKFAQMSGEQTLVGVGKDAIFRIDPRLSGNKLVADQTYQYAKSSRRNFTVLTSDESGRVAAATENGMITKYNRLGIRAAPAIPALGDPITGLDMSADGNWILATCKTYLLLIDATLKKRGKNVSEEEKKKTRLRPIRLQIKPEHAAYMTQETGQRLNFTKAHFNAGLDSKEQTVVTSSGPYVVTWSLKKILRGDAEAYLIKRYAGNVTADNFKFGTDKNVIVALEDDVGMAYRSTFRKPTRESLATPARRVQALSRSSIVNSPF